jgi:hypothetical protein
MPRAIINRRYARLLAHGLKNGVRCAGLGVTATGVEQGAGKRPRTRLIQTDPTAVRQFAVADMIEEVINLHVVLFTVKQNVSIRAGALRDPLGPARRICQSRNATCSPPNHRYELGPNGHFGLNSPSAGL